MPITALSIDPAESGKTHGYSGWTLTKRYVQLRLVNHTRRTFLKRAGIAIAAPSLVACAKKSAPPAPSTRAPTIPIARPADWDAVAFNLTRGKAGAIPEKYMKDILGPGGIEKHLGKHLPYIVQKEADAGYVPLMWGDAAKGYTKHPNAPKTEANPEGHWYNWVRIALANSESSEITTEFDNWPVCSEEVNGKLIGFADPSPEVNNGKNAVYLCQLPEGAKAGDTIRIWAHCLTHGEYIDFVTLG